MKRQPKLYDILVNGKIGNFTEGEREHITRLIKYHLADAKRFCFDDPASEFMGQLLRRAGREVLAQHEWARAPYPKTWVEINHAAYYDAMLDPKDRQPALDGFDGDAAFGVMFNGNIASTFSLGRLNGMPVGDLRLAASASPWQFHLHEQTSYADELEMAQYFGFSRLTYRQALLGSLGGGKDSWWDDEADHIARSHRLVITRSVKKALDQMPTDERRLIMIKSAGELKIILTLLLLLTRPHKNMVMSEVGHHRTFHHGKPIVLKAHSSITMRIEHDDPVTRYVGSLPSSIKRQLHDVRGHWGAVEEAWQAGLQPRLAASRYQPFHLRLRRQAMVGEGSPERFWPAWRGHERLQRNPMSKREAALRAGHMEEYKIDGQRLYLYWERYGAEVKKGRYYVDTVVKEGFTVEAGLSLRYRFNTLREADEYVFSIRDKTPADLALKVFGVIVTPDDD